MSSINKEINLLEKTLIAIKGISINNLDFNMEAALIRHFEVVGGIAKELYRSGIKIVINNTFWTNAIRTRDKISHSYYSLRIEPLLNSINDIDSLLKTIPKIREKIRVFG